MDTAASVAALMGFGADRIEDIKTAVSEATLNAIEHGNALEVSRRVRISLVSARERLEITVQDRSSRPFGANAALNAVPSLADKLAGRSPPRGWGLFLIRSLVDHAEFSSTRAGNIVRMVVRLGS
jgi:serine/threonine-protein kinase RsbW